MTVKKSVTAAGADAQPNGEVGLFWIVEHQRQPFVLAVSVSTGAAQRYGDHLMLDLGHHEHWNALAVRGATALRAAGLPTALAWSEYEEWPRGRVSFDVSRRRFVILADRKLHNPDFIALIASRFGLKAEAVQLGADPHYKSSRRPPAQVVSVKPASSEAEEQSDS
jgi:hypothetical protein